MIKNLLWVGLLAVGLSWFVGGCTTTDPHAVGALGLDSAREVVNGQNWDEAVLDSKSERWDRLNLIRDIEDREFRDDLDMIFMVDRSSKLTYWHPGVYR
jgi:hypothetical protein